MAKSNFYVKNGKAYRKNGKLIGTIFTNSGYTTSALDGKKRSITVVGIRIKKKEKVVTSKPLKDAYFFTNLITNSSKKKYDVVDEGLLLTTKTEYSTLFKFGYAICNPEDHNDPIFGLHLAVKRALGAKRTLTANSFSLLGDDSCIALIDNEYDYISKNINKYLICDGEY